MGKSRIEIYMDEGGEWRWRMRAGNGAIVATSGEGFVRKSYAIESADEYINGPDEVDIELDD